MSNIDPSQPTYGEATTRSVRDNFAIAKSEIEALQQAIDDIEIGTGGPFLKIAGGTMLGRLFLAGDPVDPLEAATRGYVDAKTSATPTTPTLDLFKQRITFAALSNPRTNNIMSAPPTVYVANQWQASFVYNAGDSIVQIAGYPNERVALYRCTTTGTSASAGGGPIGTGGAITDGTVVWAYVMNRPAGAWGNDTGENSYLWLGRAGSPTEGGVVNFMGGHTLSTANGTTAETTLGITVTGTLMQPAQTRYRFITDDPCPIVRLFSVNPQVPMRLIVDGHFVSRTSVTNHAGALNYMFLNFATRKTRDITIDVHDGGWWLYGIDALFTTTVIQPPPNPLTMILTGDSIGYGASATELGDGFFAVLCDLIGVQNAINTAIGGCGYLQNTGGGAPPPGGSGLAIDRIDDVLNAIAAHRHSIVLDENGFNDTLFSPAEVQAACTAYINAIRARFPTVPIIEMGIFSGAQGTMSQRHVDAELAKKAAVDAAIAAGDENIWFIPLMTGVGGPMMTGDGNDLAPNGSGNSDVYVYGGSLPHPNTAGHAYYAAYLAAAIRAIFVPVEQYTQDALAA